MKILNIFKGKTGEDLATKYLKKRNYIILEKNYKSSLGETDIIAYKKKCIVFVEVKSRTSNEFGTPSQAVDKWKIKRLKNSALIYLNSTDMKYNDIRFDVIEVSLTDKKINHIKSAFTFDLY